MTYFENLGKLWNVLHKYVCPTVFSETHKKQDTSSINLKTEVILVCRARCAPPQIRLKRASGGVWL